MAHATPPLTLLILAAQAATAEAVFNTLRQAQLPVRGSFTPHPQKLVRAHRCELVIAVLDEALPAADITPHYQNVARELPLLAVADPQQDASAVLTLLGSGSSSFVPIGDDAALIRAVRRVWKGLALAQQIEQLHVRLKLSEQEIQELIGHSSTPIARVHDSSGRHLNANAAYRALFGIPDGQAVEGMALLDLVAPEYRDAMRTLIDNRDAKAIPTEPDSASLPASQTCTAAFTAPDGRCFSAQVQATPDVQDEVICLQVHAVEEVTSPSALALEITPPPPPPLVSETGEPVDEVFIAQIERALATDGFKLVFQPIVSLHGDSQENYSVLLRLLDDTRTLRPADDVIESAARTGHLPEVDRWVIGKALAVLSFRRQLGHRLHFFLNISASVLRDEQFLVWLCDQLREHGVRGSWVSFQLREVDARAWPGLAQQLASGLKQIKSRAVLAQFGLQPDSELLLAEQQFALVKLAPSLTQHIATDVFKQGRVNQLVQSAKQQEARTIAVCIEDEASLGFAWSAGVAYVQGHLLGRPSSVFDIGD